MHCYWTDSVTPLNKKLTKMILFSKCLGQPNENDMLYVFFCFWDEVGISQQTIKGKDSHLERL